MPSCGAGADGGGGRRTDHAVADMVTVTVQQWPRPWIRPGRARRTCDRPAGRRGGRGRGDALRRGPVARPVEAVRRDRAGGGAGGRAGLRRSGGRGTDRCGRAGVGPPRALLPRTPAWRAKALIGFPAGICIHDPPRSTGEPARSTVCSRPPIRSLASSTTHSAPACVRAFATVKPAIPAPTTTTRSTGPATPPGTSARPSSKLSAVNATTPHRRMINDHRAPARWTLPHTRDTSARTG